MRLQEATETEAIAIQDRYESVIGYSTEVELTIAAFMLARKSMSLLITNSESISDKALSFAAMEAVSNAVEDARKFLCSNDGIILTHNLATINYEAPKCQNNHQH